MYQSRIHNGKKRTHQKDRNRYIIEPDDEQEYAVVTKMLGNARLNVLCCDNKERLAKIRGSMRKGTGKTLIEKGDLVLISKREFEDDKVDIIHKYHHEEASVLMRNDIPEALVRAWNLQEEKTDSNDIDYVVFSNEDINNL